MTFPLPGLEPPITLSELADAISIPDSRFPRSVDPAGSVPMRLPRTLWPPEPARYRPSPRKRLIARPRTVDAPAMRRRPSVPAPARLPSISTTGALAKPGCVVPSSTVASFTDGSAVDGRIV
jgi:hypothetical protein